jgi:alkaline phosphatase D
MPVRLTLTALACLSLCRLLAQDAYLTDLAPFFNLAKHPFYYGVASGDPTPTSIILWTKISPDQKTAQPILWEIATDTLLLQTVARGTALATPENNFAVSVDVEGLQPHTRYFYRFNAGNRYSETGRTQTAAAANATHLKLAVVSCSNLQAGYFNAYGLLARRNEVDAILHLGDYIYEYEAGTYGDKKQIRTHLPTHEIKTLEDYRARYAQYRLDTNLQKLHALFPFITVWDDHEIANDAYADGAQNHQPETEGDWETRKNAAVKAYYEWMPVRRTNGNALYRQLSFGQIADLWLLDERLTARSKQVSSAQAPNFLDTNRYVVGPAQFQWLKQGMQASTATWRILGNQVILSTLDFSAVLPKNPKFMDMWDGYPAERNRLFDLFENLGTRNFIVVTGDCHTSWGMDLIKKPARKPAAADIVGMECTTPSISSANFDEYAPRFLVKIGQLRIKNKRRNPHIRYLDLAKHGYLLLDLTPTTATAQWFYAKTLKKPALREEQGPVLHYALPQATPPRN